MLPVLVKVSSGWKCERCSFECFGRTDAETHTREHGVDPSHVVTDAAGDIYSLAEVELPDVLRMEGRI